jgi:hypothetical protein
MEFFIKKNATLPLLVMQVIKHDKYDHDEFMNMIETSTILFTMVNVDTGVPKISSKAASFVSKTNVDNNSPIEYYIYYKFNKKETSKIGRYEGQFLLKNSNGELIVPISDKLFINIQDSFITDNPCC